MRLTAARGGVGIELSAPMTVGPLRVLQVEWSLPGLSFPLDLSGGVREFRHRRGVLQGVLLELDPELLGRWLTGRAKDLLGGLTRDVAVWPNPDGLGIGLSGADGCVAFELLWAPSAGIARLVIDQPRVAGSLRGPAISHVLRVTDRILGRFARRSGRIIDFGDVCKELVRAVLPPLGVRVPSVEGWWLSGWRVEGERFAVAGRVDAGRVELSGEALAALELAESIGEADELLVAGRSDDARAVYMTSLERAPRHPELCRTIASIDKDYEERYEAALGLLVEALPATHFGLVGAELLASVGDDGGAELAVRRQADAERFAPLAALLWVRLAEMCESSERRGQALDAALACSPSSEPARWARLRFRLFTGDVNGALGDAEHLEAAARGSTAKHAVIVAAASEFQAHGHTLPARRSFERALRYLPTDVAATLGLARCFLADGGARRALVLLRRAAELVADDSPSYPEVQLELAKLLASHARDLPDAIARARRVTGRSRFLVEARALEARWRAQLGDVAGAGVAFGKLKDCIELLDQRSPECVPWLLEAARFAEEHGDDHLAERQLALALRIDPRHGQVLQHYRSIAGRLAAGQQPARPSFRDAVPQTPVAKHASDDESVEPGSSLGVERSATRSAEHRHEPGGATEPTTELVAPGPVEGPIPIETQTPARRDVSGALGAMADTANSPGAEAPVRESDDELEVLAEDLMRRLMTGGALSPDQYNRLAEALRRLGRDDELHAVSWGLFEDADDAERREFAPQLAGLLERLLERSGDDVARVLYEGQLRQVRPYL